MTIDEIKASINDAFQLAEIEQLKVENISSEFKEKYINRLREYLVYYGKKCGVYEFLIKHCDEEIIKIKSSGSIDDFGTKEWVNILQADRNISELLGYLTLLEMDAMMTCISLLQANTNTERIILCKHSYTIIYEALEDNLFHKISKEMKNYPDILISEEEYVDLWKEIKEEKKKMSDTQVAKLIRNNIDAHKSYSFIEQLNTYRKCQWTQSVIDMGTLIQIGEMIQEMMGIINSRKKNWSDEFGEKMKDRVRRLDEILKELNE